MKRRSTVWRATISLKKPSIDAGVFRAGSWFARAGTKSLKGLKKTLFSLPARLVFEMKVLSCTDDEMDIDFYYCPLVASWQAYGLSDEKIAHLCDITMQGGRGIAASFGYALALGETIAERI